ncbi:MAG: hypothetical protein D6812_00405 [Deltaproteobacteria bacterium]|nr:MAG: hypothetical protein D6812_00405 [Deltaproteobacteria bacterium]
MKPVLFTLFGVEVWSFPFFLACGYLAGGGLAVRRAPREGIDPLDVVGLAFWTLLLGLLGARLGWVLLFLEYYRAHPALILEFQDGGLSFYGGLLAGLATVWGYGRLRGVPFHRMADLGALSTAFALSVGSVGLLLSGSCYGSACPPSSPFVFFAITFPDGSLGRVGETLYPTQPLLIAGNAAIFLYLRIAVEPKHHFEGEIFTTFLSAYTLLRFFVGWIEGSPQGGIGPLSDTQIVSLLLFLLARAWAAILRSRGEGTPWGNLPI